MIVVDASAVFELVLRTPTGLAIGRRLVGEDVIAPDILDAEVASALRRARRSGALGAHEISPLLGLLHEWPAQRVPTRPFVVPSSRWWGNVSVYDALYLAIVDAAGARLVTCDGRLARAPGTGVPVENVRVT